MSKKKEVILHLKAYTQLLEAYYAITKHDLYRDEQCLHKDAIQQTQQNFASERFGFLMVIGRTLEILDNATEALPELEEEIFDDITNPYNFTVSLLDRVISEFINTLDEPENVGYINQIAQDELGYLNDISLHSGRDLGAELVTERMIDFLNFVPLHDQDLDSANQIEIKNPPSFKYHLNKNNLH